MRKNHTLQMIVLMAGLIYATAPSAQETGASGRAPAGSGAPAPTLSAAKLSPLVRQALSEQRQGRPTRGAAAGSLSLTAFVAIDRDSCDAVLAQHGCRKYAQWGDIAIAAIPTARLGALAAEPSVRRIEASRPATVHNDTTATIINTTPAYQSTAAHQAYTGRGVVVGLVDVGFDLTHPTFLDSEARHCRIGAFWDQLSRDTVGSRMPVGRDFVGAEAIMAAGGSTDSLKLTHGTHTLGTAAGNGYDTPYRGMAYDSDICLVANAVSNNIEYIDSADYYKYTSATDALAFKYCLDYAESQGRPCVVSLSEGYTPYLDREDSLYAAVLDSLSGPGRIIVASAGNGGVERTYIDKPAGNGETGAFVRCNRAEAYYHVRAEGAVRLALYRYGRPAGIPTDTLAFETAETPADTAITRKLAIGQDTLRLSAYRYPSSFGDHDMWQLQVAADSTLNKLAPMALTVAGEGRAEVFGNSTSAFRDHESDSRWTAARRGHNIIAPSCFPAVISVGATAHRLTVANEEGQMADADYSGDTPGTVWRYSSTGPSMSGLSKPDVVAPGTNVVSAYSHHFHPAQHVVATSEYGGERYFWGADSGTSMAAPAVAGVIALWLQAKPDLTPADIRGVMSRCCRHPEAGLSYPNTTYGYGEIDAYRGLLDILGLTAVEGISQHQPEGVRIVPADGGVRLCFDQAPSAHVYIKVYSMEGACLYRACLTASGREMMIALPAAAAGICAVQVECGRIKGSCLVTCKK